MIEERLYVQMVDFNIYRYPSSVEARTIKFWKSYGREYRPGFALPPTKGAADDMPEVSIATTFQRLRDVWKTNKLVISSISKIVSDPAYLKIIGLGPDVLPHILEELRREPDFWFVALEAITRENPVRAEHAGDIVAMAEDWLQWEHQRHRALVCA